jgi:hypothetical protein
MGRVELARGVPIDDVGGCTAADLDPGRDQ